jgi:hypothetical protein
LELKARVKQTKYNPSPEVLYIGYPIDRKVKDTLVQQPVAQILGSVRSHFLIEMIRGANHTPREKLSQAN